MSKLKDMTHLIEHECKGCHVVQNSRFCDLQKERDEIKTKVSNLEEELALEKGANKIEVEALMSSNAEKERQIAKLKNSVLEKDCQIHKLKDTIVENLRSYKEEWKLVKQLAEIQIESHEEYIKDITEASTLEGMKMLVSFSFQSNLIF